MSSADKRPPGLKWTDASSSSAATGATGLRWRIYAFEGQYGIVAGLTGEAEWAAPTLEAAKDLVAELDAERARKAADPKDPRPRGPRYHIHFNSPVLQRRSLPPDTRCACGSKTPPEQTKPPRQSLEWWDDPSTYWECPDCGAFLDWAS